MQLGSQQVTTPLPSNSSQLQLPHRLLGQSEQLQVQAAPICVRTSIPWLATALRNSLVVWAVLMSEYVWTTFHTTSHADPSGHGAPPSSLPDPSRQRPRPSSHAPSRQGAPPTRKATCLGSDRRLMNIGSRENACPGDRSHPALLPPASYRVGKGKREPKQSAPFSSC